MWVGIMMEKVERMCDARGSERSIACGAASGRFAALSLERGDTQAAGPEPMVVQMSTPNAAGASAKRA